MLNFSSTSLPLGFGHPGEASVLEEGTGDPFSPNLAAGQPDLTIPEGGCRTTPHLQATSGQSRTSPRRTPHGAARMTTQVIASALFVLNLFSWSIVALLCCVSFGCKCKN